MPITIIFVQRLNPMYRSAPFIFIVLMLLNSCSKQSKEFPGYSLTESGVPYMLIEIGESEIKPQSGDYITADLSYLTMDDSVFFNGRRKLNISKEPTGSVIEECFMLLSENEKARYIVDAYTYFVQNIGGNLPSFIDSSSNFKLDVRLVEIQSPEDYQNEKEAFLSWIKDFKEYENVILNQFLEQEKLDIPPTKYGFYKIMLKEGNLDSVHVGDTVILNYEGRFLNGRFFDSTIKRKEPFGFVYGTEWQVIEGLDEAIGMMTEGEKSLFIFPSYLAFGQQGSSTGIVPPYTSVIFEVELLEIN